MPFADADKGREWRRGYSRMWRAANPEKMAEYSRTYKARHKEQETQRGAVRRATMREKNPAVFAKQSAKFRQDNPGYVKEYYRANRKAFLLKNAKYRAQRKGVPFAITVDDVVWSTVCPLLGVSIDYESCVRNLSNGPSIDRIEPSKGYVKGNVWVVSYRANSIKLDATFKEFETIYQNWKRRA